MSLYQQATLETREAKAPGIPLAQRVIEWRATADRVLGDTGLDRIIRTVFGSLHQWDTRSLPEIAERVLGLVSEERSTWKPAHVRAEAERQLRAHPLAVGAHRDAAVDAVQRGTSTSVFITEAMNRPLSQANAAATDSCTDESFRASMMVNASNRLSPISILTCSMTVSPFCIGEFG